MFSFANSANIVFPNVCARPDGFCESAWESISPFVMTLAYGGKNIYDGWMKDPRSAMISCNDGFRPVSFLIEALDEDAE
ncbi:MAG: TIGR04076 family protein [Oscillospiraceae bacterium]|nr:TIGR04076 family protein [Oscillospiraceae bacterium]